MSTCEHGVALGVHHCHTCWREREDRIRSETEHEIAEWLRRNPHPKRIALMILMIESGAYRRTEAAKRSEK